MSVWLVAVSMRTCVSSPGGGETGEVDDFVVPGAAAQTLGIGARGPFDEHLDGAADEALRALARVALDDLEQALHALHLDRVRHEALGQLRRRRCRGAGRR